MVGIALAWEDQEFSVVFANNTKFCFAWTQENSEAYIVFDHNNPTTCYFNDTLTCSDSHMWSVSLKYSLFIPSIRFRIYLF